jgi:predicted tellurium resistance membrane protein TerC
MGWLTDPQVWASLVTLTALEIVLGIDNLLFIAIVAGRLPPERQSGAGQVGLALALITRLALLASIVWIIGLTRPVFELFGQPVSWRDIVLIAGGLFLLYKGTREIHQGLENSGQDEKAEGARTSFARRGRANHAARSRVLAGQRDHGSWHGQFSMGHGSRHHHRRRDNASGIEAPRRFR